MIVGRGHDPADKVGTRTVCVYFDAEGFTMTDMRLHLENLAYDASRCNAGYTVGGILYVTVGDTAFPCEEWYDIVFTDLKFWIPRIISFGSNHADTCLLPFMDGSCQIRLLRDSDGKIFVGCIRNNHTEIQSIQIDFPSFLKSVENAHGNMIVFSTLMEARHCSVMK